MRLSSIIDRRLRVGATSTAVAASLVLTACGGGGGTATSDVKEGGTLTYVIDADAQSMNPFESNDVPSSRAQQMIWPNLYSIDKNLQVIPDFADGMPTVSADKKTWTVKLRKGAKWSDGSAITAKDVVTTIQIEANPDLDTDKGFDIGDVLTDPVTGVSAKDDYTVVFTLKEPFAPFLANELVGSFQPASVYGKIDPKKMRTDPTNDKPTVTGGPYRFDKRITGQEIDLVANPDYYNGKPHYAKVVMKVITDSTAAAQALINGDLTWDQEITAAAVAKVKAAPGVKAYTYPDLGYYDVRFNDRPGHLFGDVNVRRAFAYALDKDSIVKAATDGFGTPLWSPIVPASAYYDAKEEIKYNQDIAKAKGLMDTAGWKVGADGIREKDGKKFSGKFFVRAGKPQREKAVQIMSEELRKNLGMDLKPTPTDFKIFYAPIRKGDYDLALAGFSIGIDPDLYDTYHSKNLVPENKSGSNWTGYKNPALDAAIEEGRAALKDTPQATFEARKKANNKVLKILSEDVVSYMLWADNVTQAFNKVGGVVPGKNDSLNYVDRGRDVAVYGTWYQTGTK